ncbi:uncharacterized protein FTOL_04222 [Fusarium torulosum]|uniref:Cytochrome b5 heme-binding domain-containing protein n=1 Tax=Fusarium torulosum TaxID=33205 RepID=A0AAE8SGA5_9HYPO|nr:uncharacterized protein FTOL_04222 [Fusarium torulosum]
MPPHTLPLDVTKFVSNHPGGADVVRRHAGHDIEQILKDSGSHRHSSTAYEVLDDFLTGILAPNDEVKRDVGDS